MPKSTCRLTSPPSTSAAISAVQLGQIKIEELEAKLRDESLKIIWEYDAENEKDFPIVLRAFIRCIGSKAEAGRKLLVPMVTMHRWLAGTQIPRIFLRASFKARMIELVSNDLDSTPTDSNDAKAAHASDGTLQRRRFG